MTHSSSWFEHKLPAPAPGPADSGPAHSPPPPPAPSSNTTASGGGARAMSAVKPMVSFRCQLAQRLRDAVGSRSNRFVATITGYNEETVRRYLRDGGPSAEFLASVCREFGVSADWLLLGLGPMRPAGIDPGAIHASAERTAGVGPGQPQSDPGEPGPPEI